VHSAELTPVADRDQTQSPFDLFLIFAGANIVATTLQIGASLPALSPAVSLGVIVAGSIGGALLVALLAPIGSRLRVPSIVAARAALGYNGAQVVAVILFVTNFVWIAVNNVIAAAITSQLIDGGAHAGVWAVLLGIVATLIVLGGPRAVGRADRLAVPMLLVAGVIFSVACASAPWPGTRMASVSAAGALRGFDVVFGYQTSWLLMFGDYSRYTRSGRRAGVAVFAGLGLTALWFIPLGWFASRIAASNDPGVMVTSLQIGVWGGVLIVMATLTTNFVNIYMSALALKSLWPETSDRTVIWIIGGIGSAISVLSSAWLDQMANFTIVLAGAFVPVGGLLLAHFAFGQRRSVAVSLGSIDQGLQVDPGLGARVSCGSTDALYYGPHGEPPAIGLWRAPGLLAWAAGAVVYYVAQPIGGTLPGLAVSIAAYLTLIRRS
jgi:purine-cytosine permease-like protein